MWVEGREITSVYNEDLGKAMVKNIHSDPYFIKPIQLNGIWPGKVAAPF